MAKLTIEAAAEDFEKAVEQAYQKNKNKLSVPGFRKGKVPRKMIEQMYGKEVFYEEAANIVIPSAYAKAVDECEEEIVSQPTIDVVQLEAGKPFIFTAEVALKPEVTLGKYKGIEIDKIDTTVTDEEPQSDVFPLISEQLVFPRYSESTALQPLDASTAPRQETLSETFPLDATPAADSNDDPAATQPTLDPAPSAVDASLPDALSPTTF